MLPYVPLPSVVGAGGVVCVLLVTAENSPPAAFEPTNGEQEHIVTAANAEMKSLNVSI